MKFHFFKEITVGKKFPGLVMKDFYSLLNIDKFADNEAIQKAYKKLVLRHHPDKNLEFDSTNEFLRIHMAYKVLIDPKKRKEYDKTLEVILTYQLVSPERKKVLENLVQREKHEKDQNYPAKKQTYLVKIKQETHSLNSIYKLVGHFSSFISLKIENESIILSFTSKIDATRFCQEINTDLSDILISQTGELEKHILERLRSFSS
jgi:curved DNA-binding protein CbpA